MSLFFYTSSLFFPKTKIIRSSFFDIRSCDHRLWCGHSFLFVLNVFFIINNESIFAEHIHIFTLKVTCHAQSHFVRICKVCVSTRKFLSSFVIHKIAFGNYARTISHPRNKHIMKSVSIFFIFEIEFNSIKFAVGIGNILEFYCFYMCSSNFSIITIVNA